MTRKVDFNFCWVKAKQTSNSDFTLHFRYKTELKFWDQSHHSKRPSRQELYFDFTFVKVRNSTLFWDFWPVMTMKITFFKRWPEKLHFTYNSIAFGNVRNFIFFDLKWVIFLFFGSRGRALARFFYLLLIISLSLVKSLIGVYGPAGTMTP